MSFIDYDISQTRMECSAEHVCHMHIAVVTKKCDGQTDGRRDAGQKKVIPKCLPCDTKIGLCVSTFLKSVSTQILYIFIFNCCVIYRCSATNS